MPFESTLWTLLEQAGQGDQQALRKFVERYRPPIVAYIQGRGFKQEAEDLAQEVFLTFVQRGIMKRIDRDRGRFRSLVLTITRNLLVDHVRRTQASKRGGGQVQLHADMDLQAAAKADPEFDREWASYLFQLAMKKLEQNYPQYHTAVQGRFFQKQNLRQIAEQFGKTEAAVATYLQRGKQKLADYVREEIHCYSLSHTECTEELTLFKEFLPRS